MKKYENILFDLDGTLSDSGPGIKEAVSFALEAFDQRLSDEELRKYIGPPLYISFARFNNLSEDEVKLAIERFHMVYDDDGIYKNSLYPGIEELLKGLKENGYRIYVATSKPEPMAKRVLSYFKVDHYFDAIIGSGPNESRSNKDEVIKFVLDTYKLDRNKTLMIGDRFYDVEGAHKNGVDAMGILYGYGDERELKTAGADIILETALDVRDYLL